VVERDPTVQPELIRRGHVHVIGDATDEDTLQAAGLARARVLLALLPSDADNLYLIMTAKWVNPAVRVIARARDHKAEMNTSSVR
jgi:voltage-gated potassium channel